MTKKSPNQNQNTVKIIAKLLNTPEEKITNSIDLFSNIHADLEKCLERLSLLEEKDYVSFLMTLDYFFFSKRSKESLGSF